MTGDTIEWFEKRGVTLKIEDDGRMFPLSDSSQTIIDCFLHEAKKHKVQVLKSHAAKAIFKDDELWCVKTNQGDFSAIKLLITTGSNTKVWSMIKQLGHSIVTPVPSLFTFNINDNRIKDIPGVVVQHVEVKVIGTNLVSEGPLLITHVGMSAPSILKLSAYGARELAEKNYNFSVKINFVLKSFDGCINSLVEAKAKYSRKAIYNTPLFALPRRLWQSLVIASQIPKEISWADSKKEMFMVLAKHLTEAVFKVEGKSTFKEEFVTAGGIDLKEINFKTFESKVHKNLYFAGEVLNIDAVTGGFNFQNAWTGAFIASKSIAKKS